MLKDHLDDYVGLTMIILIDCKYLNDTWASDRTQALSQVAEIHGRITYLSRWIDQLEERRFSFGFRRIRNLFI